jgi:hypothetical protein
MAAMTRIRLVVGAAIALAGCYQSPPEPQYPQQQEVAGPPGGGMDQPTYAQYEADSQPSQLPTYSQPYGDPGAVSADPSEQAGEPEPSADPQDPGYAMGPVDDAEIDSTLQPYGDWVEDPDYGRVWRPNATVVGVDFTPYETCGSWAWTDWGWSYTCDWGWGWLPFHYGRWGWMNGYWGWVPGHEWGPGWVDWRHGGGYVGWRPMGPEIRDHRTGNFHDHRTGAGDAQWRFVSEHDFGNGRIRPHLYKDLAEGLRVTTPVIKPAIRGMTQPIRVASTMRARIQNPVWQQHHQPAGGWRQPVTVRQQGWRQPPAPPTTRDQTWQRPAPNWQRPQTWSPPVSSHPIYTRPAYTPRPAYTRPTYAAPTYNRPTYSPPAHTWSAPSHPTYSAPSHPTYSAPSHSSYSAPSHSFGGGGGGGHSSGGGHHR